MKNQIELRQNNQTTQAPPPTRILENKKVNRVGRKNAAFTLAEVLITLAIIGVVAALTIPTVVRNYQERQIVTQLKKVYSQLNQAFQMAVVNEGAVETWDWGASRHGDSAMAIANKFTPYLKVLKFCGVGTGCWYDGNINSLGDKPWGNIETAEERAKLILADGTSLAIRSSGSPACSASNSTSVPPKKPLNASCGHINVDINGKKAPNVLGRDVFEFRITKYGIFPVGIEDDSTQVSTNCVVGATATSYIGTSCTAWILKHDNMDYLHRDISHEW